MDFDLRKAVLIVIGGTLLLRVAGRKIDLPKEACTSCHHDWDWLITYSTHCR
jgi:hypothetical protein